MKVAFIGKRGSGKSTAAQYLVDKYGFVKLSFADPVKVVTAQMLNQYQSYLHVYGVVRHAPQWTLARIDERKNDPAIRQMIQFVGTCLGREYLGYENIWIDLLLRDAEYLDKVVVDDVRFKNEAEALKEQGFRLIKISNSKTREKTEVDNHISETDLDDYKADGVLVNHDDESLFHSLDLLITNMSQENTRR